MASDVPRYSHIPKHSSHLVVVQSADPGHQQGGARQRKSTTSNNTNTSTIRAQAPSFRYMQNCAGGGYFSGRLARGFGASSCDVSEGNVRQWRSKHQVRPSGTCSFALAEATFLDAWEGVRSQFLYVLEGNVRQWRRPTKHQVCPSAIPAAGAWVHARTMTNMKLPTAATTATMLHTDSSDSARHDVVTEWACVFVDGHCLGWVTGVQNRPTEAGTVQNAPRTHSCLLFAQPLSKFHAELLLKLIYAVAPAALSQWRQALVRYLSICWDYYSQCMEK